MRLLILGVAVLVAQVGHGLLLAEGDPYAAAAWGWQSQARRPRQAAPPRDQTGQRAGTAQLAGRVTAADTGAPVRQVEISLSSSAPNGPGGPRSTRTDAFGDYRFTDLPAGRYRMRASRPGFVSLRYGAGDPLEPGRSVELGEGDAVTSINFKLPRAAVISGEVRDEFGEPVLDAEIRAMRYQNQAGQRRLTTAGRVRLTDDLGAFRIFGLLPGTYYIAAVPRDRDEPTDQATGSGYTPTYYPGTTDLAQARPITVSVGGEVPGVSFALSPVRTARLRGTVFDSSSGPAPGAQITAVRREAGNAFVTAAETRARADGTFELTNLAPGSYSVQAWVRGTATSAPEFGAIAVQPAGADVAGLELRTEPGGTLQGRVVLRASGRQAIVKPSQMEITARPASQEVRVPVGAAATARVRMDWTFELRGLSGRRALRVSGLPAPWVLEAIRINGADVTDEPIELRPGRVTTGAEIILTTVATEIDGTVDQQQFGGSPISVLVFPVDRSRWEPYDRRIQIRRASADGGFRIRGLPPGDYFAVAVPFIWQGEWSDPEFLERASASATRVSLAAAAKTATRLKVTPIQQ